MSMVESMVENLEDIRNCGAESFLQHQEEKYRYPACGEIVCVHMDECPSCKTSARLNNSEADVQE